MKESKDDKKPASLGAAAPSCERIETRIHELMDRRQPLLSDELIRQHVSECDACAELVVDFGALNDSLSQVSVATLQRLSGIHLADESETQVAGRVHPISFVVSIACLLLVMLTSSIWFSPNREASEMAAVQAITSDTESDNRSSDFREYVSTGPNFEFETVQITNENSPTEFINAVSFEQISGGVEPFQGYIDMTADLPGIHPVSTSVNATYQLIRFISENSLSPKSEQPAADSPDVGYREGSFIQLCSV